MEKKRGKKNFGAKNVKKKEKKEIFTKKRKKKEYLQKKGKNRKKKEKRNGWTPWERYLVISPVLFH